MQIVRSAIITPKSIETTTSDIGDDVEEADDNKELDSRVESNIACENCKFNKAKIVYLQKKVSKLKKKRAELYAKIEQVFLSLPLELVLCFCFTLVKVHSVLPFSWLLLCIPHTTSDPWSFFA